MTLANDDFASSIQTTGRLAVGGNSSGAFENSYDADWFKVHLDAGKNYLFGTTTRVAAIGLIDPKGMPIYLPTSNSTDPAVRLSLEYRAQISGDYYFAVSTANALGAYTAYAKEIPLDDYAPDAHSAGILAPDSTVAGVLEASNDYDTFSLNVAAGSLYRVTL